MNLEVTFFGPLRRRAEYETNPDDGSSYAYNHYRVPIAEDCEYRCVYCDCHEDTVGGREAMELDHFRPWQKGFGPLKERKFEHLRNEPKNLVHACGACNGFKWSHWPTEDPCKPYDHEKGWIEPFEECRSDFLEVLRDGTLRSRKAPGEYQIRKLRLNRPLLRRLREVRILKHSLEVLGATYEQKWKTVADQFPGTLHAQTATQALHLLESIQQLLKAQSCKGNR